MNPLLLLHNFHWGRSRDEGEMFLKHLPTTFETTRRHGPENRKQNS